MANNQGERAPTQIVEEVDIAELLTNILESMDGIQDRLDAIHDTQAEVLEKLDNLSLPGSGFSEDFDS